MAEISYSSNSPDLAIFDYHPIPKEPWVFLKFFLGFLFCGINHHCLSPASSTTYPTELGRVSYQPPEPRFEAKFEDGLSLLDGVVYSLFFLGGDGG